jgi:hypothetical protein
LFTAKLHASAHTAAKRDERTDRALDAAKLKGDLHSKSPAPHAVNGTYKMLWEMPLSKYF